MVEKETESLNIQKEELSAMAVGSMGVDMRMAGALAGDRKLNAREMDVLLRLQEERGDALYSDIMYTLTHHTFGAKQARILWREVVAHRKVLQGTLGRDVGLTVAAHDYLVNVAKVLKNVALIEEEKITSIANAANRDGLTGLFDHATFKHRLREEMERQHRYGGALTLVMFDIDHFKKLNDTFGHAEGDVVLKQVAQVLMQQVRKMDTAARYGGEEFAVILPEVELAPAKIFAERLRQKIQTVFDDTPYKVTISVGLAAQGQEAQSAEDLVRAADKKLYEAKEGGRNRVCG